MSKIKSGDTVKVHYTGQLNDGSVFDSSLQREPLEFTMGSGQLIPGFEKAIEGLEVGDSTTANIPAAEAYGEPNPQMIVEVTADQLPAEMEPQVGMQLQLNQPDGQAIPVQITGIEDDKVTLDANHPLAGQDLTFQIEVVEIA